jgi:hypothetical protein
MPLFTQLYIFSYKSFFPQSHLIAYALPLSQRLELNTLKLAVMEKYVFAGMTGNKSIAMLADQTPYDTCCHDYPSIQGTARQI